MALALSGYFDLHRVPQRETRERGLGRTFLKRLMMLEIGTEAANSSRTIPVKRRIRHKCPFKRGPCVSISVDFPQDRFFG
jgi:hypothetical protein